MTESTTPSSPTDWLTLLRIGGDDRIAFLQGQLTQDLALLGPDRPATLAASCDAKGRVLALLTLIYTDAALYAAIRSDVCEAWVSHVLRYRLRAKVTIEPAQDAELSASLGGEAGFDPRQPDRSPVGDDPAHASVSWCFGPLRETLVTARADSLANADWQRLRLRAGIADIGPAAVGGFTPHMLNLDRLGAISFRKGCYTGQEVVARTEHLGAVKRRAWLLSSVDGEPVSEGANVLAGDQPAGRVAAASGDLAIAVLGNAHAAATLALEDGRTLQRLT